MIDYQLVLFRIKSELMDLLTEDTDLESYEQWFEALKPILCHHFDINETDFFISNHEKFLPINGHRSAAEMRNAVRVSANLHEDTSYIKEFTDRGYGYADEILLICDGKSKPLGLLLLKSTDKWREFTKSSHVHDFERMVSQLILTVKRLVVLAKREKDARRLFGVTELFSVTMDSQVILDGILEVIAESFPFFHVELLLSHEQKELTHSYKLLDYMNERTATMDAFVSGNVTVEEMPEFASTLINAPIKGRQGIYGVLQIKVPIDFVFSTAEQNFIRMVADAAGNALENASLYDQSHCLIEDLQLVNETSRKLNSNMPFGEMISFLKQQLLKAFQPLEIAFVFYDESDNYEVSPMSTEFFRMKASYAYTELSSTNLKSGKEALFEANYSGAADKLAIYESIVAIPIMNQENLVGFVVLLHRESYFFSFNSFKLMRSLIGHSSLAIANSILRDQLQELVDKDNLTKLYTRSYLDKVVEKSIATDEMGVFLLLDVDDFKLVNDTYGHATGDDVLKQISSAILSEVAGIGVCSRWGGEEIAVYLPSLGFAEGAKFASRLVSLIPKVTEPEVTVSIGMSNWTTEQRMTFHELFHYTDAAMYRAKNNGKNQVIIHEITISHL